jgi:hypothetical protein
MKYIVYVSQAAKPFTEDQLADLLSHSRNRNTKDGITGLLIYRFNDDFSRGNFVQVLEGPEESLENVWSRISKDKRHHTVVVVEEGSIDSRMFGSWSMGFKNIDAKELKQFEGFSDLGSDKFWKEVNPRSVGSALELAKSFYQSD